MTMSRRSFLLGSAGIALGAGALMRAGHAAGVQFTTVVEIANFQCSRCLAVNDQFERLQRAAYEEKVDLVFAPAAWEGQSLWPNRVYYSLRDLYPSVEALARNTLFEGIHTEGQLFESLAQVGAYFARREVTAQARQAYPDYDWEKVAARADSNEPLFSEIRAGRLIDMSGIQEVPSFLWLGDGKISSLVTPSQAGGDAAQLVALVLKKLSATQ